MTLGLAIIGLLVFGYVVFRGVVAIMDNKADKEFSPLNKDKHDK